MELHHPTLFAMLVLGSTVLALVLLVAQRGPLRRDEPIRDWSRGSWVAAAGYLALLGRDWLPMPVPMLAGNLGSEVALTFFASALHRFLSGTAPPRWLWWWLVAQILLLLAVLPQPYPVRVVWLSTSHVLLMLPPLWWLLRARAHSEQLIRAVFLSLAAATAVVLFRAIDAALHPELYAVMLAGDWRQGLAFVAAYVFLLGSGTAFALANLERSVRRLERMAHTDALTGCMNRRAADEQLEQALQEARANGQCVALVLMDLDHFKRINDAHGHRTGDLVLQRFAQAARSQLMPSQQLARLGGEEFGLVLPRSDLAEAARYAERLRAATETLDLVDEGGSRVSLTLSAGVAVGRASSPSAEWPTASGLYTRADRALYQAKALGRNRVVCAEGTNELP
jgi:diguanylate cyclase (GGDEF)-like protein